MRFLGRAVKSIGRYRASKIAIFLIRGRVCKIFGHSLNGSSNLLIFKGASPCDGNQKRYAQAKQRLVTIIKLVRCRGNNIKNA